MAKGKSTTGSYSRNSGGSKKSYSPNISIPRIPPSLLPGGYSIGSTSFAPKGDYEKKKKNAYMEKMPPTRTVSYDRKPIDITKYLRQEMDRYSRQKIRPNKSTYRSPSSSYSDFPKYNGENRFRYAA